VAGVCALLPADEPQFETDARRLRRLRGISNSVYDDGVTAPNKQERLLHKAVLDVTVTQPVGDLLDIGCGRGRLLKLLSSRASRAVGVDIDADARHLARSELLLAGLANCSLRNGDMYCLPFAAQEFDTIILDDVLASAARPVDVLNEAQRVLRPGGRLLLLQRVEGDDPGKLQNTLASWSDAAYLRLKPVRRVPTTGPLWLLAEAQPATPSTAAA